MIGTTRSTLDFAASRPGPGVNLSHELIGLDDDDRGDSLLRAYHMRMGQEFAAELRAGGRVPTFADALMGMVGSAREFNDLKRRQIDETLGRAQYRAEGRGHFTVPPHMGLKDFLFAGVSRTGTESLSGGSTYGFLVKSAYADVVADKNRRTIGPWSFANIFEVKECREYKMPVVYEPSLAISNQMGGFSTSWGHGELVLGKLNSDGKVAQKTITQDRLLMYTKISSDIWADSASLARWFWYTGCNAFRNALEYAMIQGNPGGAGPRGVVTSPFTVVVARQSGSTIEAADILSMHEAIADDSKADVVWHASSAAMSVINNLAVSGTYPFLTYPRNWSPDRPREYPTIFGRPLVYSPYCSAVGTTGDLIAVDWSSYFVTWIRPRRSDVSGVPQMAGALEFSFTPEADVTHRGFIGLPEGSMEARASTQFLFDTDTMAVGFKWRGGGDFNWASPLTVNGITQGPAAVLTTGT